MPAARVGFLIGVPEHLELFEAVARRLPGCRMLLDAEAASRQRISLGAWSARGLARAGWKPTVEPAADLDLLVTADPHPPSRLGPWLREGGIGALWWEGYGHPPLARPEALLLPAERWRAGLSPRCPVRIVGDPRLDSALDPAARSRARCFLGLAADPGRHLVAVFAARRGPTLARMAASLRSLRPDADVVIYPPSARWLGAGPSLLREFCGPGIALVSDRPCRGDVLAAADLLVLEGSLPELGCLWPLHALALGKPVLVVGEEDPRGALPGEVADVVPWVLEPSELAPAVRALLVDPRQQLETGGRRARELLSGAAAPAAPRWVEGLDALVDRLRPPARDRA